MTAAEDLFAAVTCLCSGPRLTTSTFLPQAVLFTVVNHLYLLDIVYSFLVFLMASVELLVEAGAFSLEALIVSLVNGS